MRLVCFMLSVILTTDVVMADERAERSCRHHNASDDLQNYVTLDSPGYPEVAAVLNSLSEGDPFENSIPLRAMGDFMQMGISDLTLPLLAGVCSYDMYAANACKGNAFWPTNVTEASLNGQILVFTTGGDQDVAQQVEIANPEFDMATVTNIQGEVTQTDTWVRKPDGTEFYTSMAINGDETSYTERPDCSGEGRIVRHNARGLLMTNTFSWSSAKAGFTFQYKICAYQDDPGCHEGAL